MGYIIKTIIVLLFLYFLREVYYCALKQKKKIKIENEKEIVPVIKEIRKTIYRPQSFETYEGQSNVKNILKPYITRVIEKNETFPHTLIFGNSGLGKTTLARIIANYLEVNFEEQITSSIKDIDSLIGLVKRVDGGILFLDEIHGLSSGMSESMYTVMEDFIYNGEDIKPFTLMGATTELGDIIKNRRPFFDRFDLLLELENYKVKELANIIKHYKNNIFAEDKITEEFYYILSKSSRGSPRRAIRLLKNLIYFNNDLKKVLKVNKILKDGYTTKDLKILDLLKSGDGVGLENIALYLNIPKELLIYEIEPYLLQNNLIIRTARGRKITEEGLKKYNELKRL